MIPKKLFTPKCLYTDREIVFQEDIRNFYSIIFQKIIENFKIKYRSDSRVNEFPDEFIILSSNDIFNYKIFKSIWSEVKMSMLHFAKSKEENSKEYYEVLYGEFQMFLNADYNYLYKLFSIFSLYSLYYTQITDFFYQINTTPEILQEMNNCVIALKEKFQNNNLMKEVIFIINKLYHDDAFSIGTLIGLKTIILNKYGLPMEQKQKVYKEYSDIRVAMKNLEMNKIEHSNKLNVNRRKFEEYSDTKLTTLNLIKEVNNDSLKNIYCQFINMQQISFHDQNKKNSYHTNFDLLEINEEDLNKGTITNLDLQFNQIDNNIFN